MCTLPIERLCRNRDIGRCEAERVLGSLSFRMRIFYIRGNRPFEQTVCIDGLGTQELDIKMLPL